MTCYLSEIFCLDLLRDSMLDRGTANLIPNLRLEISENLLVPLPVTLLICIIIYGSEA